MVRSFVLEVWLHESNAWIQISAASLVGIRSKVLRSTEIPAAIRLSIGDFIHKDCRLPRGQRFGVEVPRIGLSSSDNGGWAIDLFVKVVDTVFEDGHYLRK
jgi:hypothetical protein